jgi:UDP-N-acetylmuramoyl-L-alanyl-D-glutamate--2,6-diaminopimelate ligase
VGREIIVAENSAQAASLLAQASRGNPASQLTNLAVTGTNGKTTVAYLVRSCIRTGGEKCGLIGTIIYDTGSSISESVLTTPDSIAIAQSQSEMVDAGAKYMVIEASSHALAQNRLAGIEFEAAAFTNLSGDHLDYHVTEAAYLAAKTRLFESLSPGATAVLNKESPQAAQIAAKTRANILWYAVDTPADLTAHIESADIGGSVFTLEWVGQRQKVMTVLLGRHNISNHLAAAGLSLAAGMDLQTVAAGLSGADTVPGRLEKVNWDGDFSVLVDYAHTDDALRNVLSTLEPLCVGSLRVVFGCGGDRDRTKRPRMARVAEELADLVIVTSDNPRTEKPEDIISEIVTGFENPNSQRIIIEPDRKKAIELAIKTAGTDDIILIAGKGHETYQIIGTQRSDFSDKDVAQESLQRRK